MLDSYEPERKPLAERNTAYARQFRRLGGPVRRARPSWKQDGPAGEAERARASAYLNAHVRLEFNIPGVTFGGRYDGSPLIVPDGSAPPPDAAEHLRAHRLSRRTARRTPGWPTAARCTTRFDFEWTLLVLGPEPPDASAFARTAEALGVDLRVPHWLRPLCARSTKLPGAGSAGPGPQPGGALAQIKHIRFC